jgi:hypothetical protein
VIQTCLTKHASEYPCQYRHVHTCMPHIRGPYHTKPCMLPHTASPPPMAPYTLPPSLPHSPKRREPVKDARRQHADRVAVQGEVPGHETRRQSALTHSSSTCPLCPSACTCMCPMHMRHAHARVHRGSHSLCICAHHACLCACACAASYEHKANVIHVIRLRR